MMQGTKATAKQNLIVRQFTANSELAYNINTPMQKYLYKQIKPLLLVLPLLLTACATDNATQAPIISGRATTIAAAAKPGNMAKAAGNAPQTSAIRLGSAPRPNTPGAATTHVVAAGETLYRVAVNNGLRYQDLAEWNNLDGYTIKVGQVIRLTPPGNTTGTESKTEAPKIASPNSSAPTNSNTDAKNSNTKQYPKALKLPYSEANNKQLPLLSEGSSATKDPVPADKTSAKAKAPAEPVSGKSKDTAPAKPQDKTAEPVVATPSTNTTPETPRQSNSDGKWLWPTQGKVIRGFSEQNKGINIAGKQGQPVLAANDGKVVYSGSGLRGYGKLIIIRHDKTYLSAYAHNSTLQVKEGQTVKKGQKIAEMGDTDSDQVKLHFEIREMGKPVDPSKFLEAKP